MKKQIAMIMAAVLAFSNAGSMMAGELIEVEESIIDETIADDSQIVEEETALEEYAAEPEQLPEDIIMAEEIPEETVIEEAPGAIITEEEPMDEILIEEDVTEQYGTETEMGEETGSVDLTGAGLNSGEEIQEIVLDTDVTVDKDNVYFSFVPTESDEYIFLQKFEKRKTDGILVLALYDENFQSLDSIMGSERLKITYYLEAGVKYYFNAERRFCDESFTVRLMKNIDNQLKAEAVEDSIKVLPGESAVMEVEASCLKGNLTYHWYDNSLNEIEGATGNSFIAENVTYSTSYSCQVEDQYGGLAEVPFSVGIDNDFIVNVLSDSGGINACRGDSLNLAIEASCRSGEITYTWREWIDNDGGYYNYLEDVTSGNLVIPELEENKEYDCTISDMFGNSEFVRFDITVRNIVEAKELYTDMLAEVTRRFPITYFSFVPAETGEYIFYSLSNSGLHTDGYLYDADFTEICYVDDNWPDKNFRMTVELEAGTQYYFGAGIWNDNETGSYTVRIIKNVDNDLEAWTNNPEISITPGEDVVMEVEATTDEGRITYQWYDGDGFEIEGETTSAYTVENVTERRLYYCIVRDEYGNERTVDFEITIENSFTAEVKTSDFYVAPGETVVLEVEAHCADGEITYRWYDDVWEDIEGAAGPAYTLENIMTDTNIHCIVHDKYDNSRRFDFTIKLENKPDDLLEGSVKASDITLKVDTKKEQSAQIEVTENLSEGTLAYSSDNEKVTVDTEGKVTVEAGFTGFATITIKSAATDAYTEASATIAVNVLFSDVTDPDTQFYYDYVYWAANSEITTGYNDGSFGPLKDCNRAAVVTFLWRMAGKPEPKSMATFKDMTNNPDFDRAISWALENGITTGYEKDNTFRPWNPCNRAAIVTFLWRYAGSPEPKTMATFTDMTNNKDFDKAISWAAENGITTGWEKDNTFRPWNTCNRLAVVSFLARYDAL